MNEMYLPKPVIHVLGDYYYYMQQLSQETSVMGLQCHKSHIE